VFFSMGGLSIAHHVPQIPSHANPRPIRVIRVRSVYPSPKARPLVRACLLLLLATAPLAAQSADLGAGIAHYNGRRWAEAHTVFAAVVKAQPRNGDAALWYGRTFLAEGKANDAEKWLEKAVDLSPQSSEAHLWLARAVGMQAMSANPIRQPFLARKIKRTVDRAIELNPDNVDARELRWQFYAMAPSVMGGGAEKARTEVAEITKRNRYRGQLLTAGAASRARDFAAAERALKSLVTEYPDSVQPMGSFALFLADRGRPSEAFALVDAYQKRRPADPLGWFQVGRLAAATGQELDRGEEALRRYLAAPPAPSPVAGMPSVPTLATVHVRLGNIAERRGNKAAARAEYQRALALDPRSNLAKRALDGVK